MTRVDRIIDATHGRKFELVREETAPFTCACGGTGKHATVVRDIVTREEIRVGRTCLTKYVVLEKRR